MSDPDKPRKGGFQPGNKFGKGRPKGSLNKFGPNLREKLLAGIAASGEKKAKRAGVNGKVDGTAFFVEALMENTAAASALLSKLIPPETLPAPYAGPGVSIHIQSAAAGQQYLPGNEVLMPFEESREVWLAYNAGAEAWGACLQALEAKLTRAAFESLSQVPPLEHAKLAPPEAPLLQLVPKAPAKPLETQLEASMAGLSHEQLLSMTVAELMARAGISDLDPDDAA